MSQNIYSRREVIGAGLGIGASLAGGLFAEKAFASSDAVAVTSAGKVRGVVNEGVNVFKGIPYGASTTGANRFMPPKPLVPWKGIRDALAYGLSTPQSDPTVKRDAAASAVFIGELSDKPEGEDCLVLNIWTRGLKDNGKRPVMFWIHGGGFQSGSGSSPGYDGTNLCKRGDVVVVTINHRLNVMGFTYWGDIGGEQFANTGNVGMLDIVQALKWVRDNIENFGGDPHRVMIFGESGGGRKVGTLLAMPDAKGLFHRAVIESGPQIKSITREDATFAAQAVLDELQIAKKDFRKLQEVPLDKLMPAFFAASRKHRFNHTTTGFAPVVDGKVLPSHLFHPTASAVMPEIPVIVGTNRTELTLQLSGDTAAFNLDEAGLLVRAKEAFGEKGQTLVETYRKSVPTASPSEIFFLMVSDRNYCAPLMKIAERRSALGKAPVYFYYFAWETPVQGGRMRSGHALEIPFVFDNTERSARYTGGGPRPAALADKMSDAWIAFARTGNPNTSKLPTWTPYDATGRATMVFNDKSEVVNDPTKERRVAMQTILGLA
ncbi:MAG TPA: carboxylesterase family protein [Steroidobacteraceae bacterium]|nr:carboxylesterase family protein [Steroidobacteraceae bacterium]